MPKNRILVDYCKSFVKVCIRIHGYGTGGILKRLNSLEMNSLSIFVREGNSRTSVIHYHFPQFNVCHDPPYAGILLKLTHAKLDILMDQPVIQKENLVLNLGPPQALTQKKKTEAGFFPFSTLSLGYEVVNFFTNFRFQLGQHQSSQTTQPINYQICTVKLQMQ